MDTLGWDCSAPNDDCAEHASITSDREYDLWELNCCVVRDAYRRDDVALWDRVLSYWDTLLTQE